MPHSPPPDYEAIARTETRRNHAEVRTEARERTPRIMARATKFSNDFGYTVDEVLANAINDEMFAATLAKSPGRTGIHERIASGWIREIPGIEDFEVLSKSGTNAIKVSSDGFLVSGRQTRDMPGKSLDFKWVCGGRTYYAMHKYSKQSGGTQNSQSNEMRDLMIRFQRCTDESIALVVIVDGGYYQHNNQEKLRELMQQERDRPPISKALSIGDLPAFLQSQHQTDS